MLRKNKCDYSGRIGKIITVLPVKTSSNLEMYEKIRAYREKLACTARETSVEQVVYRKIRAYREKLACTARENILGGMEYEEKSNYRIKKMYLRNSR